MAAVTKSPDRSTRTGRAAAIGAVVLVVLAVAAVLGVVAMSLQGGRSREDPFDLVSWIAQGVATLAFVLSGALIVSRQPRNVIGWLLVVAGLGPLLSEVVLVWLVGLDPAPTQATPLVWLAVWFTNWAWVLLMFPIFLILLTFPDGRLLSPRWRWVVFLCGLMIAVMLTLPAIGSELAVIVGDEVTVWSVPNPIGFVSQSETFERVFGALWGPALLVVTVTSVAAVVIRYRRGTSVEREQLKWPLWAMLLFGIVYALGASEGGFNWVLEVLFGLGLAAIPISVAIAVLKYRLYEIDRIISRTVTYLLVVGLLGALYFALVTTVTSLFRTESPLAVAISTLAVAASFNPLRRRIQNAIDRRFNRAKYDAQNVMDRFAGTLRDRLDVNELTVGWRDVATETMQPTAVSVWIREGHT